MTEPKTFEVVVRAADLPAVKAVMRQAVNLWREVKDSDKALLPDSVQRAADDFEAVVKEWLEK